MRIITSRDPISSACGIHENGETEDYSVVIIGSGESIGDPIVEHMPAAPGKIQVYPNPARGHSFYCRVEVNTQSKASILLTDVSGKQVYAGNYIMQANAAPVKVNLPASVKPGLYFVRIVVNGQNYHQKIVLQ